MDKCGPNHNWVDATDDFQIFNCAYCNIKRTQIESYIHSKYTSFSLLSAKLLNVNNLCIVEEYYDWIRNQLYSLHKLIPLSTLLFEFHH